MDIDTISNCSNLSLQSEEIRSNESTLSGLSIYQDEFTELRYMVNPAKYPDYSFSRCSPKQDPTLKFKDSIHLSNLSHLQDSQQIHEKYKSDLYNLEKSLELKYYDKIEKLLKTNHRLQSELDGANEQIARLLNNYSKQSTSSLLDKNFIQLEEKYHNLTSRYSELQHEQFQMKNQNEQYETENKHLKIELSELKIDIDTKNICVKELKDKISHQYVEIETLLKNNFKYSQTVSEISSELAHLKKTQDWYKERLRLSQNEKQILSEEILKCKRNLSSQHEKVEVLNVELSKWKAKCEVIELKALQDKEKLYKQLDSVHTANYSKTDQSKLNFIGEENQASIINFYETSIQDLTNEIMKIKEYVQEQDGTIKKITKENSELIARCITLQKSVQHNEITIEELENIKKELYAELNEMEVKVKIKSDETIVRENQILNLHAELKVRKDEQEMVEQTVKIIRDQFTIFKSKYRELGDEISIKNKQILQLENEKQKLFMNNNWNICELQKIKEKDAVISQLKDELTKSNKTIKEHLDAIKTMKNEMNKNQEKNLLLLDEKQTSIDRDHLEIQKYESALTQYKIMITDCDKQITDLKKLLKESNIKIADLKDNIKILKQEINKKDVNISEMTNRYTTLESEFKNLQNTKLKICTSKYENNGLKTSENNKDSKFNLQHFQNSIDNTGNLNKVKFEKNTVPIQGDCSKVTCNSKENKKIVHPVIHNFKKKMVLKTLELEDRINKLSETCNECHTTLSNILNTIKSGNEKEQVQKLNVLLQVKDLELKEKQKKYEANNRTLLRKVKEHMKGRNAAEKHNKYLQEMYNSLSDDNNSLKLELASKDCEIENLRKMLDKFTNINEKLKISVLKLEEQIGKSRICEKCVLSNEKFEFLEKCIKDLENEKLTSQKLLMDKEDVIINFQKEIQQLLETNVSLNRSNSKLTDENKSFLHDKEILCNTMGTLENEIKKKVSQADELRLTLNQEKKQFSETVLENSHLKNCLDETHAQVDYLSNEIKILSSRLQVKSEELNQLEDNKSKIENNWKEKQRDFQTVISTLKHCAHDMQLEITSINSEKYFLQRLCNDLKLALKSHTSRNKMLQQQLHVALKEKDFNSLPNVLLNIPCDIKYDDDYINQLLQQNKAPLQVKPIIEMKSCLDTLKREISTLQEQIAKKNINF
ncbi:putative leucine-rich repeat-containing protein DDB_G0290503 isoform X2 [Anoplophora glabripennis]|uniref:putative leucine-rich repeat-containing protein DDB_G0290503 isoform X2 n=1 Tax=Anoplophora glabripennis TaxID=217634 RepID=UPI000874303C|nr:putative leucine-rich repeat-containing protein DDB_G0290503 isoform X2 [Anoplophora glabripennis]